jgi:hypothetical protein
MNNLDAFIEQIKALPPRELALMICEFYKKQTGMAGNKGVSCSKECPFRKFGGWCEFYSDRRNMRPANTIRDILLRDVEENER